MTTEDCLDLSTVHCHAITVRAELLLNQSGECHIFINDSHVPGMDIRQPPELIPGAVAIFGPDFGQLTRTMTNGFSSGWRL
jgi:hypothetical protein